MAQDNTAVQQGKTPVALNTANLEIISKDIPVPQYDRSKLKCGIMHMSVGGFHRSHQAVYLDDLLNKKPQDWMICGVGMLPQDKAHVEALQSQDTLYTVIERSTGEDKARIIGSMKEILHAPSNPQAVLDRLMDPAIKILSLTITEKGYFYNDKGDLDTNHPAVKNDLTNPAAPQTMYGYVVGALARRRKEGLKPFTVMSCDNLPGNGHLTQKLILQFTNEINADLAAWIKDNVSFPNAMVDRITPVTTDEILRLNEEKFGIADHWPVVCEDFRQWVLEDKFGDGRPALEDVGVQIVADVEPYEKMKVRLLNGSHSMLSYLSYLMGYRRVDKAMADPLISKFVRAYMDNDVTPSVPNVPGIDLDAYKDKLIERFANPAIGDQVQRLAEDGSTKAPNAILPCIRNQLKNGGSIKFVALGMAAWFKYLTGVDEDLQPIEIKDPNLEKLQAAVKANPREPMQVLAIEEIFGKDLSASQPLLNAIRDALTSLHEKGAKQTVSDYLG